MRTKCKKGFYFRQYILAIGLTLCFPFSGFGAEIKVSTANDAYQYDASIVGIKNTGLPSKGMGTYGDTGKAASEKKLADALVIVQEGIRKQMCDQFPKRNLCSVLPNDNTDFSEQFVYMFLLAAAQNSFDIFSWQSFIAMNWPTGGDALPNKEVIGSLPASPRRWMAYRTPQQLFNPNAQNSICASYDDDTDQLSYRDRSVFTV